MTPDAREARERVLAVHPQANIDKVGDHRFVFRYRYGMAVGCGETEDEAWEAADRRIAAEKAIGQMLDAAGRLERGRVEG